MFCSCWLVCGIDVIVDSPMYVHTSWPDILSLVIIALKRKFPQFLFLCVSPLLLMRMHINRQKIF